MIRCFYILQNDHRNKSNYDLPLQSYGTFVLVIRSFKIYSLSSFQICNSVLLTIVAMLYIVSPRLIYFITESLYLLTHFIHVAQPHHLPLATTYLFSVWMSLVYYKMIFICPFKTPLILSQFMITDVWIIFLSSHTFSKFLQFLKPEQNKQTNKQKLSL